MTESLFLTRRQLAALVAPWALTPEGFESLPGAPSPIAISPRRRRWRRAEVVAFLDRLEGGA